MLSDDLWEFHNLLLSRLADPLFNFPEHRDILYGLVSLVDATRLTMDAGPGLPPSVERARQNLIGHLHRVVSQGASPARLEFTRAVEKAREGNEPPWNPHGDTDQCGDSGG